MDVTGNNRSGSYDLLEKRDWRQSVRIAKHSCQDQSENNSYAGSSDVNGEKMVYLLQLLPTYLLHFTYGISLGLLSQFGFFYKSNLRFKGSLASWCRNSLSRRTGRSC